jgi:hypothetical protein
MVPGDDAVESATRKVVAFFGVDARAAQLRLRFITRDLQRADHERYAVDLGTGVLALAVRVEVDRGLPAWSLM